VNGHDRGHRQAEGLDAALGEAVEFEDRDRFRRPFAKLRDHVCGGGLLDGARLGTSGTVPVGSRQRNARAVYGPAGTGSAAAAASACVGGLRLSLPGGGGDRGGRDDGLEERDPGVDPQRVWLTQNAGPDLKR
jgi:hypothetical protein